MAKASNPHWPDYLAGLKPHERPAFPGSPATPDHAPRLRAAYAVIAALIILTGGIGNAAVTANILDLQGALGVTPAEVAWLPIVFVMTNACMGLLLVKFRIQYGLQLFTRLFLVALVAVSLANVFVDTFTSAVMVRAVAGIAASGLSTLGFLYMVQAFPAAHRLKGLVVGVGASSLAAPLARLITPPLLQLGGWQAFNVFEVGLSLISLAAVSALALPPSERMQAFEPLDFVTFALFAPGIALLAAALGLGRIAWWTQTPWVGMALAGAFVLLSAALAVEHSRARPMISIQFLTGGFVLRLLLSILIVRIVLSEQTSGAVGFLQQVGVAPDQLHGLFWAILGASMAGTAVSAFTLDVNHMGRPVAIALALMSVGALIDSQATVLTRPINLFFSQGLLAFAAALFLGPAMLAGIGQVRAQGAQYFVSFIVVFSVGQNVGGLLGSALVGSLETIRQRFHFSHLAEGVRLSDPATALRLQQLGGAYARTLVDPQQRNLEGLRLLNQQITQQSHVLAYNDVFLVLCVLAAFGSLWVTFHYVRRRRLERRALASASAPAARS